jgi:hypothetical protein
MLGCVVPNGDTGTGATNIVLSLEDPNVGQGFSVAVTGLVTNGWANDLTGGTVYWKPIRSDITFQGGDTSTGVSVLATSEQVVYKNIDVGSGAFPGSYSIYATYCFSYLTDGYRRIVVSSGTTETSPASSYTDGPMTVTYGGVPKINTNVQDKTSLQFTFDKATAGTFYGDHATSTTKNQLTQIEITYDNSKLDVTSNPTDFTCAAGTCTATNPMIISDKYSAAFEFTWVGGTVTTEQEQTIGVEATYDFCIDSNTVNINVVG